jgi:hypothetical protein
MPLLFWPLTLNNLDLSFSDKPKTEDTGTGVAACGGGVANAACCDWDANGSTDAGCCGAPVLIFLPPTMEASVSLRLFVERGGGGGKRDEVDIEAGGDDDADEDAAVTADADADADDADADADADDADADDADADDDDNDKAGKVKEAEIDRDGVVDG